MKRVTYRFEPCLDGPFPALAVEARFEGGSVEVRPPIDSMGQTRLADAFKDLRVEREGPDAVRVSYCVVQDWEGLRGGEWYYRAVIGRESFHAFGPGLLILPDWDQGETVSVTLEWAGGWPAANSFGAGQAVQTFESNLATLHHAVYTGGAMRRHVVDVKGRPVNVVVAGRWLFTDEQLCAMVGAVVRVERDFWEDHEFPYYLVALLPIDGRDGCGGTCVTDSFVSFGTPGLKLGFQLAHNLAHELFHAWTCGKIAPSDPAALRWFVEGFTDYYADVLLLRAGIIGEKDYAEAFAGVVERYRASSVMTAPNSRVIADFWSDMDVQSLPYLRGRILAHNWDVRIRARTSGAASLDDVMRGVLRAGRVSNELLDALIKPYLPEGIGTDLRDIIEAGAPLTVETVSPPGIEPGSHT